MDGRQIRAARERAGLTQGQLGELVGVGLRTVGNWERGETVPRNRMARIQQVLSKHLDTPGADPLESASDVALLAELARRLDRAKGTGDERVHTPPTKRVVTTSRTKLKKGVAGA